MPRISALSLAAVVSASLLVPTSGAPVTAPSDSRLQQTVTFESLGEPLEVILQRLSKQTGVSFTFEGREVGDRKALILVRGVPLKDLKATLATTFFGFRWRERQRKRDNQGEYVLFQNLRSKQIEQALESLPEQQHIDRLRQLLAGLHGRIRNLDAEGQALLRDPGARSLLEGLDRLGQGQVRSLLATGYLSLNLSSMPLTAAQRSHWAREVGMKLEYLRRRESGEPDTLSVSDLKDAPPYPIDELPNLQFGFLMREQDDTSSSIDLLLSSSLLQHKQPGLALADAHVPLTQASDGRALQIADVREFLTGQSAQGADAQDQRLGQRIRPLSPEQKRALMPPTSVEPYGPYWARWIVPLAKRAGISLISDHYTEELTSVPREPTGMILRDALDEGQRAFRRRWTKQGPLFSFRHEHWYRANMMEPPQRVIDRLQARVKQNGRLDVEDLAVGGELNRYQITRARYLGLPYSWIFRDHYSTMRLLYTLTPIQWRAAQERGVTVGMVATEAAREWFRTAAWQTNPNLGEAEMRRTVFRIRRYVDPKNNLTLSFDWLGPSNGQRATEEARLEAGAKG